MSRRRPFRNQNGNSSQIASATTNPVGDSGTPANVPINAHPRDSSGKYVDDGVEDIPDLKRWREFLAEYNQLQSLKKDYDGAVSCFYDTDQENIPSLQDKIISLFEELGEARLEVEIQKGEKEKLQKEKEIGGRGFSNEKLLVAALFIVIVFLISIIVVLYHKNY